MSSLPLECSLKPVRPHLDRLFPHPRRAARASARLQNLTCSGSSHETRNVPRIMAPNRLEDHSYVTCFALYILERDGSGIVFSHGPHPRRAARAPARLQNLTCFGSSHETPTKSGRPLVRPSSSCIWRGVRTLERRRQAKTQTACRGVESRS